MPTRTLPMLLLVVVPLVAAAQTDAGAAAGQPQPPAARGVSAEDAFAAAAPRPGDPPPGIHRVLGGHRFEPSSIVTDPFSSTAVGARFGYVYATVSGQYIARSPPSIECCKDADVGGFGGSFGFSVRAADWLMLRVDLASTIYSGLNRPSIIIVGPGLRTSAQVQAISGFQLGDRVRLAGLLGVGTQPELNILLLSGLVDAIKSGDADVSSIFDTSNTLVYNVGASAAWAMLRSLGLVAEVEYVAPNKVGSVSTFSANGIAGAAELDWNLRELWASVPIGLSASYRILSPLNTSTFQAQQDFQGAIGYTGRAGLSARMGIGGRRFNLRSNQLLTTALVLDWIVRYDW